jgi:hypothetical protein
MIYNENACHVFTLFDFRVIMGDNTVSSGVVVIHKKERVNGWSCPPHPFQVVAWFFVVAIPLVYYGSIVSHLPHRWIPAGCSVSSHIWCIIIKTYTVYAKAIIQILISMLP